MSTFLITGASSGIGAATALRLDREGHDVVAGVECADDGREALASASPRLRRIVLDVTSADSVGSAAAELVTGHGGLDGVVNNAGIGIPAPLEVLPLDDLRRLLEVNVVGQIAVTQAVLPLVRQAGGRIVFVGSVGGVLASQFAGAYHASKFALEAVADVWRQELDPEDIPVVLEALTTERPDTRYVVGGAGRLATALRPLIPDRLADRLGERTG